MQLETRVGFGDAVEETRYIDDTRHGIGNSFLDRTRQAETTIHLVDTTFAAKIIDEGSTRVGFGQCQGADVDAAVQALHSKAETDKTTLAMSYEYIAVLQIGQFESCKEVVFRRMHHERQFGS